MDEPAGEQPGDRDARVRFALAEYESVRREWLESRTAQQQTFAWTLAGTTVLVAATFRSSMWTEAPWLYVMASAGLSVASLASFGIWFGEVSRMERASLYLRGLERDLGRMMVAADGRQPLLFERYRAVEPPDDGGADYLWVPKSSSLVKGALILYIGLPAFGLVMLGVAAFGGVSLKSSTAHVAAWVLLVGLLLTAVRVTWVFCKALLKIRESSSGTPDLDVVRAHVDAEAAKKRGD